MLASPCWKYGSAPTTSAIAARNELPIGGSSLLRRHGHLMGRQARDLSVCSGLSRALREGATAVSAAHYSKVVRACARDLADRAARGIQGGGGGGNRRARSICRNRITSAGMVSTSFAELPASESAPGTLYGGWRNDRLAMIHGLLKTRKKRNKKKKKKNTKKKGKTKKEKKKKQNRLASLGAQWNWGFEDPAVSSARTTLSLWKCGAGSVRGLC